MRRAWVLALTAMSWGTARGESAHHLVAGIAVEERFDSAAFGGGQSELLSKLSPELGWAIKSEVGHLDASYALDLIDHLRGRDLSFDHRAKLDALHRPTERLTLRTSAAYYHVEDMTSLPRFGVARVNGPALWVKGELAAEWKFTHLLTGDIAYRPEASRVFVTGTPLGTTHLLAARLRDQVGRRFVLGAEARGQLFLSNSQRYADAVSLGGSVRYLIGRHSFAQLDAGPLLFRSARDGNAWLPRAVVELGYEARGQTLGLVAGHDIVGAAGYATAVWADFVQVAATYRMTLAWSAYLGAGYFRNGRAPSKPADTKGLTVSAGVEWKVAPGLALAGAYDHFDQFGGADAGLGLRRNIVSLRLSYRTP